MADWRGDYKLMSKLIRSNILIGLDKLLGFRLAIPQQAEQLLSLGTTK